MITSYVSSYHRKPVKRVRVWDILIFRIHIKQISSNNSSEQLCPIQCAVSWTTQVSELQEMDALEPLNFIQYCFVLRNYPCLITWNFEYMAFDCVPP